MIDRRRMLTGIAGGIALAACWPTTRVAASVSHRSINLVNLHTGERFSGTYAEKGSPLPDALSELSRVLRDHRTGDVHEIDPRLFDWMRSLQDRLGGTEFGIISGYRSPKSNQMLRGKSNGVAKKSWHMQGRAIDLRLAGSDTADLRKLAIADRLGGVGYYAKSDFVHLDTGRPRSW
ncbi:MAG: YcbK family protein [Alphaproteobacteria bacterium]